MALRASASDTLILIKKYIFTLIEECYVEIDMGLDIIYLVQNVWRIMSNKL